MNSKVAVIRCESYDTGEVEQAVRRGIDALGGQAIVARAGERIVLKPNVLYGSDPKRCVTTHPSVMRAVALVAKGAGANVSYGDSSAVKPPAYNLWHAGLSKVGDELGIKQADFETKVAVKHPHPLIAHHFELAKSVVECDGLINICKLKTHSLTRFTGAVKNLYGCVPGVAKGRYHAQYPEPVDFCRMLVDIASYVRPRLSIMDAVMAMEGNGPGSGTPRKVGVILMSTDPVALDAVACRLINLPAQFVPTLAFGAEAGLGTCLDDEIELVGDSIDEFMVRDFDAVRRPPLTMGKGTVRRTLRRLLTARPVIRGPRCVRCGMCVEACPVAPKAIDWTAKGKTRPPRYDYDRCIRCFCCQEVCPHKAIEVVTPVLGRIAPAIPYLSLLVSNMRGKLARRRS